MVMSQYQRKTPDDNIPETITVNGITYNVQELFAKKSRVRSFQRRLGQKLSHTRPKEVTKRINLQELFAIATSKVSDICNNSGRNANQASILKHYAKKKLLESAEQADKELPEDWRQQIVSRRRRQQNDTD